MVLDSRGRAEGIPPPSRTRRGAVEGRTPARVADAHREPLDLVPARIELDDRAVARVGHEGVAAGQALHVSEGALGHIVAVVLAQRGRKRAWLRVERELDDVTAAARPVAEQHE